MKSLATTSTARTSVQKIGDAKMADRIRKGDRQAFEIIYERYHRQLFYLARKYVKDQELAEDALQEAIVKLWVKRRTSDTGRSLKSFRSTMMRKHIPNVMREKK